MEVKQSGFGISSLVLGLAGIFWGFELIGIFPSILGIVFAIIGILQKKKGSGVAIVGLLCSIVGVLVFQSSFNSIIGENTEKQFDTENEKIVVNNISKEKEKTHIIDEIVIFESDECVIKAVECNNELFKLHIKNESENDYEFIINAISINGIMTGCGAYAGYVDIPSEKNGMMKVEFYPDWLDEVKDVEYVEMIIDVIDRSDYSRNFDTGVIRIETNKYTKDISFVKGDSWIDTNGIYIIENYMNASCVSYSIVNDNDYFVSTTLDKCSINDWAFEPGYSTHISSSSVYTSIDGMNIIVFPNCIANVVINTSDFMEEYSMDKIEKFEFYLKISNDGKNHKEESTEIIKFVNE